MKLLVDLKPALDGYAGIPQEARLLFAGLLGTGEHEVSGLLQHGAAALRACAPGETDRLPPGEAMLRHSRNVISFYTGRERGLPAFIRWEIKKYIDFKLLCWHAGLGRAVVPGILDGKLFPDFIWSRFFAKSLNAQDRQRVTAAEYRVLRMGRKTMHHVGIGGPTRYHAPNYLTVDTRGYDVMLAQTPFPGRVTQGTTLVVRYHDAVPVLLPHTISDKVFHQASHYEALKENVRAGAWFSCISAATRNDLIRMFPEVEPRSSVIHNIISDDYFDDQSPRSHAFQVIGNRLAKVDAFDSECARVSAEVAAEGAGFDYLLMVSTLEPRKNHLGLLEAWARLKLGAMPNLKLVVVGSLGWEHGPILEAFRLWVARGDLCYLSNVPAAELRVLYRHAAATVCPSLAEGFDYSGVEAMRSGGIVVASDIPVHREIYADAAKYFDPYDVEAAAQVIESVLDENAEAVRVHLRGRGTEISARYTATRLLPQWVKFFNKFNVGSQA